MTSTRTLANIPMMGGMDNSTRGRILRAAAHLFKTQGYARTTVREIAGFIGMQSGSLFRYFDTKEAILRSVMEEAIEFNLNRIKKAISQGATLQAQLYFLVRTELEAILGETGDAMTVLLYEWDALTLDNQTYLLFMRDQYEAIWMAVLVQMKDEGLLDYDPFVFRRLLVGAIGWTHTWYNPKGNTSLDQLAEMLVAWVNQPFSPSPMTQAELKQPKMAHKSQGN